MISIVVKTDHNRCIGDSAINRMPRESSTDPDIIQANKLDMQHFVSVRKGSNPETAPDIVIMGRKTRESIPTKFRPFKQNINYIISRNPALELEYNKSKSEPVQIFLSIEDCLAHINKYFPDRNIHIVGGGQIYDYVLKHNLVDQIYLTLLDAEFNGDVYFPHLGEERKCVHEDKHDKLTFYTYQHKKR